MDKLIVEIYLPAALQGYDVRLPTDVPLYHSLKLAGTALTRLSEGLYVADENAVLLERETGAILNINMTPRELGLRNGSRLVLI